MIGYHSDLLRFIGLRHKSFLGARLQHFDAAGYTMAMCKTMLLLSMSVLVTSGCEKQYPSCDGHDSTPPGELSEYELRAGGSINDIAVAPPLICEDDWAYIRIERVAGARRLGTASGGVGGGFREGCTEFPMLAEDPSQCPVIDHGVILRAAFDEMEARGLPPNGRGAGPCADTSTGDYESWNMSVGVVGWMYADEAVNIVAELLDKYDLRGVIGVAVVGYDCAIALE